MASDASSTDPRAVDATWHAIEQLIEEVADLSRSNCAPQVYLHEVLTRARALLAAGKIEFWMRESDRWMPAGTDPPGDSRAIAHSWLDQAAESEFPIDLPATNSLDPVVTILCRVTIDGRVLGVLGATVSAGLSREAEANRHELLAIVGQSIGDFYRQHQFRQPESQPESRAESRADRAGSRDRLVEFSESVHRELDLESTCYSIVNEGRRLLGCDRISVLVGRGRRWKVRAISGLDRFDKRSNEIRQLESLASAVAFTGEPLWSLGDATDDDLPDQIAARLSAYVDESTSRTVVVIPLLDPELTRQRACLGILVIERFAGEPFTATSQQLIESVSRHSLLSLRNAIRHAHIPRVARWLGIWMGAICGRRILTTTLAFVLVAAAAASLVFVETDFDIQCRGELRPQMVRDIFAPIDGSIIELAVNTGDLVAKDDELVLLHNADLDLAWTRLTGEVRTTQTHLLAVEATIATLTRSDTNDRMLELAAEVERLKQSLRSLEAQREVLERQRGDLRVASPLDGRILTSDLAERLVGRPVRRGQRLMHIGDVDGPWLIELRVPDHDIGHIRSAQSLARDRPLGIVYLLTETPGEQHSAKLSDVGIVTENDTELGTYVTVEGTPVNSDRVGLRPGASVVARIHCGRRSIGYVWGRDLVETLRTRFFF